MSRRSSTNRIVDVRDAVGWKDTRTTRRHGSSKSSTSSHPPVIRHEPQLTTMFEWAKHNALKQVLSFLRAHDERELETIQTLDLACGSTYLVVKWLGLMNEFFPDRSSRPKFEYTGMDLSRVRLRRGEDQFCHKVSFYQGVECDIFDRWPSNVTQRSFDCITCFYPELRSSRHSLVDLFQKVYHSLAHRGVWVFTTPLKQDVESNESKDKEFKMTEGSRWSYIVETKDHRRVRYEEEVLCEKTICRELERAGFQTAWVTSQSFPLFVPESERALNIKEMNIFKCYTMFVCYKLDSKPSSSSSSPSPLALSELQTQSDVQETKRNAHAGQKRSRVTNKEKEEEDTVSPRPMKRQKTSPEDELDPLPDYIAL